MKKQTSLLVQKIAVALLSTAILILLWIFIPSASGNFIFNTILAGLASLLLLGYAVFFCIRKTEEKTRTARALVLLTATLAILIYYNFFV